MVRTAGKALAAELLYGKKDSGLLSGLSGLSQQLGQQSGLSQQLSQQQLSQLSELSDCEDRVGVSSVGRTPPRGDGTSLREQVRVLLDGRKSFDGEADKEASEKSFDADKLFFDGAEEEAEEAEEEAGKSFDAEEASGKSFDAEE
eukprot:1431119-Rhodomonas_salina.1